MHKSQCERSEIGRIETVTISTSREKENKIFECGSMASNWATEKFWPPAISIPTAK